MEAYSDFILKRIDKSDTNPKNKTLIKKWVEWLTSQAKPVKQKTLDRHVYSFEKLLAAIPKGSYVLDLSKDEMVGVVGRINRMKNLNQTTRAKCLITLKSINKHFLGEDERYTKEVSWIKPDDNAENELTNDDLLTPTEITAMINKAHSVRDRVLIALMGLDGPLRTHEVLALRRKSVHVSTPRDSYVVVPKECKTGTRQIPLIHSLSYMRDYLNMNKDMKPDSYLFWDEVYGKDKALTDAALRRLVERAAKRVGITKRVVPYTFRHTRITALSNILTNAQLEVVAGWKHGSNMHKTYEHLADSDVAKAMRAEAGITNIKEEKLSAMKPCPNCHQDIDRLFPYCPHCNAATNEAVYLNEKRARKIRDEAAIDPKQLQEFMTEFRVWKEKQTKN